MTRFLIASVYSGAEGRSHNVGDALISASCQAIVKSLVPSACFAAVCHEDDPMPLIAAQGFDLALAPAFPVQPRLTPQPFHANWFAPNAPALRPLACSSITRALTSRESMGLALGADVKRYLDEQVASGVPITTRDAVTNDILSGNGVPSCLVGDFALFDQDLIGKPFQAPTSLSTIAFTPPRSRYLLREAIELCRVLRSRYSRAQLVLALHGHPNDVESAFLSAAGELFNSHLSLVGSDVGLLDAYRSVDLHIGYRIHAHLFMLRNRKASLVLCEDSRGVGFSQLLGLSTFVSYRNPSDANLWQGLWTNPEEGAPRRLRLVDRCKRNTFLRRALGRASVAAAAAEEAMPAARWAAHTLDRLEATNFFEFEALSARIDSLYHDALLPALRRILRPFVPAAGA